MVEIAATHVENT